MKGSKSYGDLLTEMKKEQAAQYLGSLVPNQKLTGRKLSSQTPPPKQEHSLQDKKNEEWITWPDLVGVNEKDPYAC